MQTFHSKILELEEELKVVGNNMKSLEVSEQEVQFESLTRKRKNKFGFYVHTPRMTERKKNSNSIICPHEHLTAFESVSACNLSC